MKSFIPILLIIFSFSACYYDNEQDIKGVVDCDTSAVKYSVQIVKIMNDNCNNCHSTAANAGGVILDNYNAIKGYALDGSLYGSVSHNSKYSAMPKGAAKMSDCNIATIKAWVDAGALNN